MVTITLNKRNQVTLPKAVRQRLGLRAGASLVADVVGGAVLLAPAEATDIPFESPPTRNATEILEALRATELYSEQFLSSLMQGLSESEYFNAK